MTGGLLMLRRRTGARAGVATAVVAVLLAGGLAASAADEQPAAAPDAGVTVDIAFGRGIDRATRTLVEPGTEFGAGEGTVWCLSRVRGMAAPDTVTHAWYHEGKTMTHVRLGVGSGDWRTWSSKNYLPEWTGRWEVRVLDSSGKLLGTGEFTVNQE